MESQLHVPQILVYHQHLLSHLPMLLTCLQKMMSIQLLSHLPRKEIWLLLLILTELVSHHHTPQTHILRVSFLVHIPPFVELLNSYMLVLSPVITSSTDGAPQSDYIYDESSGYTLCPSVSMLLCKKSFAFSANISINFLSKCIWLKCFIFDLFCVVFDSTVNQQPVSYSS